MTIGELEHMSLEEVADWGDYLAATEEAEAELRRRAAKK